MQFSEAPILFPEDQPFWEAARQGQLLLKWCNACGKPHFHPRPHCPLCGSRCTAWRAASGRGRIYSFTRTARGAGKPLAPAVIELDEGVRVTSVVTDADLHALAIDDEVVVSFGSGPAGEPVLAFTTPAARQARAYSAQALKASADVRGVPGDAAEAEIVEAAVIGGGRMGVGIAIALLTAGIRVQLVDANGECLERARKTIADELSQMMAKGRLEAARPAELLQALHTGTDMAAIANADLVVEAVWEQMGLKKEVFRQINTHAKPGAILGTNTSTLDVDQIAGVTGRPDNVLGLHFFSPAHVMKLLEVVRGPRTGVQALLMARTLARRMRKVAVVVGICHGFVGNRLMIAREAEAARLLLDGATPQQVDRVLTEFGLPMGTFELQDMAGGIELSYRRRQETGEKNWLIDRLFEAGRTGQRAGKGYYRYEPGKRAPIVDPEVTALIQQASREAGITRRALPDQEVLERLVYPMINEGAKLMEEGIVERGSDIDVVWQHGFGWPAWKGGPMYYADQVGTAHVCGRLRELCKTHGDFFRPARLLEEFARTGMKLSAS
ncbi:MAG: 3-hydroxyacyl-CoA dehydrogenase [Ramlibacter sp.]|jgi:3-hydroxyacyl-CoA dehydrogenase|nr:3-hydroxyacyl-CoA dehydrogenase [Ramlibacter sp.]